MSVSGPPLPPSLPNVFILARVIARLCPSDDTSFKVRSFIFNIYVIFMSCLPEFDSFRSQFLLPQSPARWSS